MPARFQTGSAALPAWRLEDDECSTSEAARSLTLSLAGRTPLLLEDLGKHRQLRSRPSLLHKGLHKLASLTNAAVPMQPAVVCALESCVPTKASKGPFKKAAKVEPSPTPGVVQQQQQQQQQPEHCRPEAEKGNPSLLDGAFRNLKLLFSGAMSAVVSRTFVAPLERVKMDLLLKNSVGDALSIAAQIHRTEGLVGFWRGNLLNVLRTAPFKAVNFFAFDTYHHAFQRLTGSDSNTERFAAGACAGITATIVCFPLDVVRTRLMSTAHSPKYGGPFATLFGIARSEGVPALYAGCLPAVIGMAPAGAIFYGVSDWLRAKHSQAARARGEDPEVGPVPMLLYGAMAGVASELFVYPLEVIRRKIQLQGMAIAASRMLMSPGHGGPGDLMARSAGALAKAAAAHTPRPGGPLPPGGSAAAAGSSSISQLGQAVVDIWSVDGFKGFYAGLAPNLLQVLPSAALSYLTYNTLKSVLKAEMPGPVAGAPAKQAAAAAARPGASRAGGSSAAGAASSSVAQQQQLPQPLLVDSARPLEDSALLAGPGPSSQQGQGDVQQERQQGLAMQQRQQRWQQQHQESMGSCPGVETGYGADSLRPPGELHHAPGGLSRLLQLLPLVRGAAPVASTISSSPPAASPAPPSDPTAGR